MSAVARANFDWNALGSLRLRASALADGLYVGGHRSVRRGVGVEFGGHRNYVPGDDLRWLDRHALARHGRALIREFETETDRMLRLVIDATGSMGFRSAQAPVCKLDYALTLAGALARLALNSGDPISLDWFAGENARWLPAMSGRESFERLLGVLGEARAAGDASFDSARLERSLATVGRYARRGAIIVMFSDLVDLEPRVFERIAALGSRGRTVLVVEVLDPEERHFPFSGAVRLRTVEGQHVVETDADLVRERYLAALDAQADNLARKLEERGGRLIRCTTSDSPVGVLRSLVTAALGERL